MSVPEHAVHYLEIVTPDVEAACRLYGPAITCLPCSLVPVAGLDFPATEAKQ